ncbi:MAG: beta-propeller domain-containing protein [Candidatus Thermoplasmatota archaeon]|nr:beta-propeller domain-containing protein [Candidatus Thermoplasmatota archaeon]
MEKKTKQLTGIIVVALLICTSLAALIVFSPLDQGAYTYKLNTFDSYDELFSFLQERFESAGSQGRYYDSYSVLFSKSESGAANDGSLGGEAPPSYSTTNVQVAGVDEPDIVKTDGTYLYVVANQTIYILRAYPVFEAAILSTIKIQDVSVSNIFIRGDRLVIFGNSGGFYGYPLLEDDMGGEMTRPGLWWGGVSQTVIAVYDLTDHLNPSLVKEIRIDGGYFDARLIDEYVYVVATEYTYHIYYALDEKNFTLNVPKIRVDNVSENISADDIYYVDVPELSDTMTHVISLNLDTNEVVEKSFMLGSSQTMYVSKHNIFLASLHYPFYSTLFQGDTSVSTDTQEATILHKISIDTGAVAYIAQGEVPGHILNQFSMDEHNGFFRIATTSGNNWGEGSQTSNNIYILDENLKQVSEIENIAPGESIYAARFLGDRAYLVTFVQVDPLFTIDLSDPYNPQILGELKIPGYSEYLHPYDETHIIGIGKEVDPTIDDDKIHTPGAVYYTAILGLKIALFDVSDINNPVEQAKIVIGDRGTDSPALYDHKAFLFDREKELLVVPLSLYEITQEVKDRYIASEGTEALFGTFAFQGAYVYHLSLEKGFEYQGRITHQTQEQMQHSDDYYWYWGASNTDITRSLFIGDVLYTISDSMVKLNNLMDLSEISSIGLT